MLESEKELAGQAKRRQQQLDAAWSLLETCHPETVLFALARAFEDNTAAASAVGVDDGEVSLVVVVPPVTDLPERKPSTTLTGNLSLKKLSKTEAADLYKQLVFGHVLATLREAFAVVPGLRAARVVAVRAGVVDAYGRAAPEVVSAVLCHRSALEGIVWEAVDALAVINTVCAEKLFVQKGLTKALQPISLADEPDLQELVAAIDLT